MLLSLYTLLPLCFLVLHPIFAAGYSWELNAPPKQCSNLSITITGSDGIPPYRILIVPFGASPTSVEVRSVLDLPLESSTTAFSFPINYPANSSFLAVVSDTRGFGSGGTSVVLEVAGSSDTSCFSTSNPYKPLFFYYVDPGQLVQCQPVRVSWVAANVQGTPSFMGVIPGGQSFPIQVSNITGDAEGHTGFSWTTSIREQTTILIVSSDNRATGAGGSAQFTVGNNDDANCLSNLSPSSTPGTPAGSYPTGTSSSGASNANGSNGRRHRTRLAALIGGVVGGVIGGLCLIFLIGLLCYYTRRNSRERRGLIKARPSSSFLADRVTTTGTLTSGTDQMSTRDSRLAHYNPEPFGISTPAVVFNNEHMEWRSSNSYANSGHSELRPSTGVSNLNDTSSGALGPGYGVPPTVQSVLQPVRKGSLHILQHQDAGPGSPMSAGRVQRTIELPPQYENLNLREMNVL
ncbi:hypothetical protein AX15_005903 [Amanita polypyramis BW_CC]|nr:hypothetical protein AX15_005903 [Amanita polypyramis BW_CC]